MASKCSVEGCHKLRAKNGLCQMHTWRVKFHGDPLYVRPVRVCSAEGCMRKARKRGLCQLHWRRERAGLPANFMRPVLAKRRYRLVTRRSHPLADTIGRVYLHRLVLFERIGWMIVPCFWCGRPVSFATRTLFVDHLNHDRHDCGEHNLVPSCNRCNAGRTRRNPNIRTSIYQIGEAA